MRSVALGLLESLPALRLFLVLDNLAGHLSQSFVCWLFAQGIMPPYTPLGGSWLNMAESFQRILKRRALEGQHPHSSAEIIPAWSKRRKGGTGTPRPLSGAAGGPNAAGGSACAVTRLAARALTPAAPCAGAPRGPINGNNFDKWPSSDSRYRWAG